MEDRGEMVEKCGRRVGQMGKKTKQGDGKKRENQRALKTTVCGKSS